MRCSMQCTIQSARSRTSITCTRAEPSPGASTSPPRSHRTGHQVKRSLGSPGPTMRPRSEEHTSELQSLAYLVCRLLLEKNNKKIAYVFLAKEKKKTNK